MGFSLPLRKEEKMRKLIRNYLSDRIIEKRAFCELIKRLDAELDEKQIEQKVYERLRANLETQYCQKQEQEWAKIKNKIYNPLNS